MTGHKRVTNSDPGTSTRYGGNDTDFLMGYLDGDDQSATAPATINTTTTYGLGKLVAPYLGAFSYMIYIDSAGRVKALNGDTGVIDWTSATAPATETETGTIFNNVNAALYTSGGLAFVRRGIYILPVEFSVGKSDASLPLVPIVIRGEGMDITTLKFSGTATPAPLVKLYCNAIIENLTTDGNGNSLGLIQTNTPSYTTLRNVHLLNNGGTAINLQTFTNNSGTGSKGQTVENCWFDKTNTGDQCAIGTVEYALVRGCFFDKRAAGTGATGSMLGSCITSGSSNNIQILGNKFYRNATTGSESPCISLEPYGWTYDRIAIEDNTFENGITIIGGTGDWTTGGNLQSTTYRDVIIQGNVGTGHSIRVFGPNITLGSHIQNVNINDNALSYAVHQDIYCFKVAGPMHIADNMLRDSNAANGGGGGNGIITLDSCNDVEVSNNAMQLSSGSHTENAIKYVTVNDMRFFNNKILVQNGATGTGIINPAGTNTNIDFWDNKGYMTNAKGVTTFSGDAATTAFNVTHGLAITPTIVIISTNQAIQARVSAISSTTFTVTFASAPASGSNNISVYWSAEKRTGF